MRSAPSPGPGRRFPVEHLAVGLVSLVAGILAATSAGAATGIEALDGSYRFVLVAGAVGAAVWAAPWALVVAAAAAAGAAAAESGSIGIALVGLAAMALAVAPRQSTRAASAGITALVALNLPTFGFWGAPSLVAGVTFVLLLGAGLVGAGVLRERRRLVGGLLAAGIVAAGGLSAVAGVSALSARGSLEDAIASSRDGLAAIRDGDVARGVDLLEQAAAEFRRAGDRVDNVFARAARVVPVVSQHQRMLSDASEAGAQLASIAAEEAAAADVDRLVVVDGAFDLAVLDDLGRAVDRSLESVIVAEGIVDGAESQWLVAPLADRVDQLRTELTEAREDLERSRDVIDVTPWILGEDDTRRYFVILASPAETRELGGFVGAFATLTVSDGAFRLEMSGSASRDLSNPIASGQADPVLSDPESYPATYLRYDLERFWQNMTGTPDLPTVARAIADLYPQMPMGAALDGVIYMDPEALQALVALTGPVAVEGREAPLRPDEVAEYLLRGQYIEFPDRDERTDVLDAILDSTVNQLLGEALPEPRTIFDTLQPSVQQSRLRLHVFDDATQALFDDVGLGGALVAPPGDYIALRQANGGQNKLDAYLERDVTVDVVADPTSGSVRTVLTAEFTSLVDGDLPDYVDGNARGLEEGTNQVFVAVYSVLPVDGLFVDGVPTPFEPVVEYGLRRATFPILVAPGETVSIEARLVGFLDPGDEYRLLVDHQPLAIDDEMTVIVRDADSFEVTGPDAPRDVDRAEFTLDRRAEIVATYDE